VTDHADVDVAPAGAAWSWWLGRRLQDHAQLFAKSRGNDAPGKPVQCHEAVGKLHRAKSRRGVLCQVLIDIGATELDDQRARRVVGFKPVNRLSAAPRMDGDHHVGRLVGIFRADNHAMTELPQNARPTQRRDAVSGSYTGAWRRDKDDDHGSDNIRAAE
jgi:hypothetical protein